MKKQRLTLLRVANYFTKLFLFGLFLTPSVLEAQCVTSSGSVDERVAAGTDDASQIIASPFTTTTTGSGLALMSTANRVGLRFSTVNIPVGATITSAYIEFTASATASTAANPIIIQGEKIDNAPTFAANASDITNRTGTTSTVSWTPTNWTSGTAYQTSSISSIIQEIVNGSNWAANNNLVLMLTGISGTNTRTAHSTESSTATTQDARLVVTWQLVTAITTTVNVSDCFDSNGNTAGGTSQTNVQVTVDWKNRPGTENIILKLQGQANVTINPDLVTNPYVYTYTLTADGTSKTLDANWSTTTTCIATQKTAVLPAGNCLQTPCVAGNTGGIVWLDFDNDGVKDATETSGVSGITVTAYDCNGNVAATTTTDTLGQYTFTTLTPSATNKYRIEFTNIPALYKPTFNGTNGRTDVQFITAASCTINLGVNAPADYCNSSPKIITSCFVNSFAASPDVEAALVSTDFEDFSATPASKLAPVNFGTIRSVYGLAYSPVNGNLFAGAFQKRHSNVLPTTTFTGSASSGNGVIYRINKNNNTTKFINLDDFFGVNAAGVYSHSPSNFLKDSLAFDAVGKVALGDIDIDEKFEYLYAVNLKDRKIYKIPVGNTASLSTPVDYVQNDVRAVNIATFDILGSINPNELGLNPTQNIRPFALAIEKGKIYVGLVNSAQYDISGNEGTTTNADLRVYVYQLDPTNGLFSQVLSSPLNYLREEKHLGKRSSEWNPWRGVDDSNYYGLPKGGRHAVETTQPMLSDIEFTQDGTMVLGFRDRTADQVGTDVPNTKGSGVYSAFSGGDMLRASRIGNSWTLETGIFTAATNEYYSQDLILVNSGTAGHLETTQGGLVQIKGLTGIYSTEMDPYNLFGGGYSRFSNSPGGALQGAIELYQLSFDLYAGKANGLGDLEAICDPAPIQVGNYVWYDQNKNGVQDPCEKGLSSINVSLWKAGVQIATTTTDANGNYAFTGIGAPNETWTATSGTDSILTNTSYQIRIDTTNQTRLDTVKLTITNSSANNGNDLNDSNASVIGNYATIPFTTGDAGSTNHTLDFGFRPLDCTVSLASNVSSCFDSNGNTTGGSSVATVQVTVNWSDVIGTQQITVNVTGATAQIINPATTLSPAVLTFQVPANGAAVTIGATYSTCTATQNVTAPTGSCIQTPCVAGNTGGTVWRDYDNDGVKDATETSGVSGITVTAYDCNGNVAATTTTDALGQYTFTTLTPSATNKYRIEFSNVPPQYKPTFNGTNGRTDVQFITTTSCTVNYGLNSPLDYCQANPPLAVPCYIAGVADGGNLEALVTFSFNASTSGNGSGIPNKMSAGTGVEDPIARANSSEIGTTWGTAYQADQKRLFATSFTKRHVGFAHGTGYVYMIETTKTPAVQGKFNLNGVTPANGGGVIQTGTITRNTTTGDDNFLGVDIALSRDLDAFAKVGETSFGDADMDESGKLWIVNLAQKSLISVNVSGTTASLNNASAATLSPLTNAYNILSLPGVPTCTGGVLRPFGLAFDGGKGYLGAICDGSTSNRNNMTAYVLRFDPLNISAGFQTVLTFPLNYTRELSSVYPPSIGQSDWQPWSNDWADYAATVFPNANGTARQIQSYHTPILSDIEFTENGSMVIGLMDRMGHQLLAGNYEPLSGSTKLVPDAIVAGDLIHACHVNGVFALEGTTGCPVNDVGAGTSEQGLYTTPLPINVINDGPSGKGEFYSQETHLTNTIRGHNEITTGALTILKRSNQVVTTSYDPLADATVVPFGLSTQGLGWYNTLTGAAQSGYLLVPSNVSGTLGKANGLGDLELLCDAQPIQVGNYVWKDTDRDGVQDPCETPLSSINVSLWKAGVQIATTTTNASGEYYFTGIGTAGETWTATAGTDSILPNMAYEIRIDTTNQAQLDTLKLTTANATTGGGNDQNDSDASVTGNYAVIAFTTGAAGSTNHTLDFGFYPCPTITTPSATQTLCAGVAGANITVNTNYNTANGIKFVKFTSDQIAGASATATELAAIYAGTAMSTVTPTGASSPYTATYTWNSTDFPNATSAPITYYVYAVLNPDLGAACRPVQEIIIIVNPTPSVTDPANQTVCRSVTTTAVNFTGSAVSGTTYSWTNNTISIGLAASGTGNIAAFTTVNAGSTPVIATVTVTPTANTCVGTAQTFTITVNPSPSVTDPANQTLCNNATTTAVTFTGSAVAGTTYNWTNTTTSIGLAASGTGNIAAFTATNTGTTAVTATITVTPTANGCTGTAQTFTIRVNPTPSVTDPANQTVCRGAMTTAITFTGAVSGTTYNWTNNTTSIGLAASGSGDITAFTTVNSTTSPVVATITVTPTLNGCIGTAETFTITVNPKPTLSVSSAVCQGGLTQYDVPFTATDGIATTNQGTISGGSVINIPIASSVTITVTNATTGCSVSQTINPPNCSCPTVNAPTTAVDADKTICQGTTIPALTASVGAGETIDWYNALSGGTLLLANSTTYTPTAAGTFYAEARNTTSGCISSSRSDVSLTINPTPSVSGVSNQSICDETGTSVVMFAGSAVAGTTYDWTNNTPSIGLAASGSGDIGTFTGINTGSTPVVATITVTPTANGCSGTTQNFTITVKPTPSVSPIVDKAYCNTATTTLVQLTGSAVTATAYDWTNSATSIGLSASGSGDIASFTATNSGTSPVVATITVTPVANLCSGSPETFTITVNPTPSVSAVTNQVKCAGAMTDAITFVGSTVSGTDYTWTNSNATIGLAATGSSDIDAFTTINTGSIPVVATIIVTPSANGCSGATQTFTTTVNPIPTSGTVTVTPATCTNGVTNTNGNITISGIVNGVKYSYGTTGTTGLFATTATTLSGGTLTIYNLASPTISTIYTFRIYGTDTTCYKDFTAVLDPSVCPPCSITGMFTQNSCNDNGTTITGTDDYFTVTVSAVSATNGGTSGKYEVVLMPSGTVLNAGGTDYGTSVIVGGSGIFSSNGASTYQLKVRDLNVAGCETTIFTTTVSAACSTITCPPQICLPVTITRY